MKIADYRNRLISDKRKRTVVLAGVSMVIDFAYVLFNAYLGITTAAPWFITMAVYYVLFVIMRMYIVISERKLDNSVNDYEKYKIEKKVMCFCGRVLILLVFALSGTVTRMVQEDHVEVYGSIVMITIATFTFYKITMAILQVIKVRKQKSPLLSSTRNINLADAVMSILPMQASMIGSFGGVENKQYMNVMTVCVGTGIFVVLLGLGVTMLRPVEEKTL